MEPWNIEVIFVNDYAANFNKNEALQCKDSELRFCLAIIKIIQETGITPQINDWIHPVAKPEYPLDIGKISCRYFKPSTQTIKFEIE